MAELPQEEPIAEDAPLRWWQFPAVRIGSVILVVGVLTVTVLTWAGNRFAGGDPESTSTPVAELSPTDEPTPTEFRPSPSPPDSTAPPGYVPGDRPSIGGGIGVTFTVAAAFPGAAVSDVTAGGPGWVAVGHAGPVGCDACPGLDAYTGKIWSSTDGRIWREVAVSGLEDSTLHRVAAGPGGLVTVGWRQSGDSGVLQVLFSTDGATWTRLTVPALTAPGVAIIDVVGGSLFVATGSVGAADGSGYSQPVIWTSTNGTDWQERFRGAQGSIYRVTSGGPGWVALGEIDRPGSGERSYLPLPAVWTSQDAVSWTQRDLPLGTGAVGGWAQAVLDAGPGLVAVGTAEYGPDIQNPVNGFAAWRSTDGITWTPAPVTHDFLEDIGGGFLLYESADRVFAIGSGCRCGGGGLYGRWWTAPDGFTWTEHSETAPAFSAVIPYGRGVLGVGILVGDGHPAQGAILISD